MNKLPVDELPPLDQYLTKWNLRRDGVVIETGSSWLIPVRRVDFPAMLKFLKPECDEQRGADLLRYFGGDGAVFVIEADEAAVLMERAGGDVSLKAMALSGGDDKAAEILAEIVTKLHSPRDRPAPGKLVRLRDWFRALFAREAESPILARCADVARRLLADEQEIVVLHGDLHHDNVLQSARGWLAIDPKGLIGERTYEVANLLGNPWPHGEIVHHSDRMRRLGAFYAGRLNLDLPRVLDFALAHAGLAASWSIEDGRDPSYCLKCAEILDAPVLRKY